MTSLNPFLKISRQLTEVLETHQGMNSKEALSKSIEMLDLVGIPSAAKRVHDYPHQFSGGMRQRVMIAMALLCQPKLLIADEPTTALDVTIQAQILDLIKGLRTELGTTVILITHDLGVVAGMCEHIAVMYAGRIIEYGRTKDIFANPKHPYTLGLLKSVPRLDETEKVRLDPIKGSPPDLTRLPSGCPFRTRCDYAIDKCANSFPTCEKFENEHFSFCWKANEL
jgi:oligopeptide transport system ATP-binding protein